MRTIKSFAIVVAFGLFAAACYAAPNGATEDGLVSSSGKEDVPSALDDRNNSAFPDPLIELAALRSGGPPPDGIPPIDDPQYEPTSDVKYLADDEPVLALDVDGDVRAFPVQIMIWHEIVNTEVGGVPVTVSYCPLCNSAVAYDRNVGDRVLDFGTSGMLYRSSLVMYDRQTESLWTHFDGQAVVGALTGARLEIIPMSTVSWGDWKAANPDGTVLTRETGSTRSYGKNPYPGYDVVGASPFLFDGDVDGRLPAMARVLGIEDGPNAITIAFDKLGSDGVVETTLDNTPIVAFHKSGTTSALESSTVDGGRDIGSTGVFVNDVDGRQLRFTADADGTFTDAETASTWNILGSATSGSLAGTQLVPVDHLDTFWFAWGAWQPDAELIR